MTKQTKKSVIPLSSAGVWWLWLLSLLIAATLLILVPQHYALPVVGLFGSLSAVFAATLAYNAANAKVEFDREVHAQKEYERKVSVFIRAEQMATAISEAMSHLSAIYDFTYDWEQDDANSLPERYLRFEKPSQLPDIWASVGILPSKAIAELRKLTTDIDSYVALAHREMEKAQSNPNNIYMGGGSPSELMIRMRPKAAARIAQLGHELRERAIIFGAIISKEMPLEELTDDERVTLRHGEPS